MNTIISFIEQMNDGGLKFIIKNKMHGSLEGTRSCAVEIDDYLAVRASFCQNFEQSGRRRQEQFFF